MTPDPDAASPSLSSTVPPMTGVVCDDRSAVRSRVSTLLERCGISVVGEADGFVSLLTLVLHTSPTVAVITLPLPGTSGFTAASAVRAAAPGCSIVLLSPLAHVELAAREAGAYAALRENDPQALRAVLRELVQRRADSQEPAGDISAAAAVSGSSTTKPLS